MTAFTFDVCLQFWGLPKHFTENAGKEFSAFVSGFFDESKHIENDQLTDQFFNDVESRLKSLVWIQTKEDAILDLEHYELDIDDLVKYAIEKDKDGTLNALSTDMDFLNVTYKHIFSLIVFRLRSKQRTKNEQKQIA